MQTVAVQKKATWLTQSPIVRKDGRIDTIDQRDLLGADIETLLLAAEFYLDPVFAGALTNRTPEWARRRFRQLKREPNAYLKHAPSQVAEPARFWWGYKCCVLAGYGEKYLTDRDYTLPLRYPRSSSFNHDRLSHQDILSARIAAQRHSAVIDLILPNELLTILPASTDTDKAWYDFPISFEIDGKKVVRPDYFPIGVTRHFDPSVPLFFVTELETGTNHIPKTNYKSSNVGQKVLAWLDVLERDTYHTRLGLNNLHIIFSLVHPDRSEQMRDLIRTLVPKNFWPYFLWKQHPLFNEKCPVFETYREEKAWQRAKERDMVAGAGYFLEEDFERVEDTFNFITSELPDED